MTQNTIASDTEFATFNPPPQSFYNHSSSSSSSSSRSNYTINHVTGFNDVKTSAPYFKTNTHTLSYDNDTTSNTSVTDGFSTIVPTEIEIANLGWNTKKSELEAPESQIQQNNRQTLSGFYNFHINANLVGGTVSGSSISSSSTSSKSNSDSDTDSNSNTNRNFNNHNTNRYNNVMHAGIFQNNGGLFFHQGQHNSMRSGFGGSSNNSSLHGNVNILLGGAMLSVVVTVLCVVCYCCHRNIKKRTESAYRQRWLESDPNMEIYSVEQCYETSGLFMDSDETLAAQVPALSHQPPPSYDAVVAMDEMINRRISPPPGYRSTTSIASSNVMKYLDIQPLPSTSSQSSSTASSIQNPNHHCHLQHHQHQQLLQHHTNTNRLQPMTGQLPFPNAHHHRHQRNSLGKFPSSRSHSYYRNNFTRRPTNATPHEKNHNFRMLRTESCCSLERALGGCRASALDSSSSNGSILEDENISLPPIVISQNSVSNASTSSKLNMPSTSAISEYHDGCPLCGKMQYSMPNALEPKSRDSPYSTVSSNRSEIDHLINLAHQQSQDLHNQSQMISLAAVSESGSVSTASNSSSHTCECYSIKSPHDTEAFSDTTNLAALHFASTSNATKIDANIADAVSQNTVDESEALDGNGNANLSKNAISIDNLLVELYNENDSCAINNPQTCTTYDNKSICNNDNVNNNNNRNNNSNTNIVTSNTSDDDIQLGVESMCSLRPTINNNSNNYVNNNRSINSLHNNNRTNDDNNNNNNSNRNNQQDINQNDLTAATRSSTAIANFSTANDDNIIDINQNNNNDINSNNILGVSDSIDSIDSINDNGIIRLDMSRMIDKTGLPTYDAALKLDSSGYV